MEYLFTFLLVFATDILYTYYLKAVTSDKILAASFWATACTFCAAVAAISYVEDHYMLIPALIGAFVGTYVGMKYFKK
jgi:hypothetical protein